MSEDSVEYERRLIVEAVTFDHGDLLKDLIKSGISPNVCGLDDRPLLHMAIEEGSYECIDVLLKYGCNVNQYDENGQSALMRSVCMDELDLVKMMIKSGANIDEVDNTGKSALLIALVETRFDIAMYLIKKGANVNIVDKLGQSALFLLANTEESDSDKILKHILSAGYTTEKDRSWLGEDVAQINLKPKETMLQKVQRKLTRHLLTFKLPKI